MVMLLSTYQTWCIPLDFIFPCAPGAVIISPDIIHSIWWLLSFLLSVMDRRLGSILSSKHSNIFSLKSDFSLSLHFILSCLISCVWFLSPISLLHNPVQFWFSCVSHPLPFLYLCGTQAYCSTLECSIDLIKARVRTRQDLSIHTHGLCRVLLNFWGYFALKVKMSWLYKSRGGGRTITNRSGWTRESQSNYLRYLWVVHLGWKYVKISRISGTLYRAMEVVFFTGIFSGNCFESCHQSHPRWHVVFLML